jgi:hypothetical protein
MPANTAAIATANRSMFQLNLTLIVCLRSNMRATLNCPCGNRFGTGDLGDQTLAGLSLRKWPGVRRLFIFLGITLLVSLPTYAGEEHDFVAEAEAAYRAAQNIYSTNQSAQAGIDAARTAFDYADLAPNDTIRETVANNGITAARTVIASDTNSAPAHYYLALDIGQVARTKMLGALKLLTEMERELKTVVQLDPKFDYAGAYRTLGVLYLEAPGWPTSVGSKTKARANLEKALELAPEDPDNHLSYMEALAKWREWKTLTEKLSDYKAIIPAAKQKFTGPDWNYEWHDWAKREQAIQAKLQKH